MKKIKNKCYFCEEEQNFLLHSDEVTMFDIAVCEKCGAILRVSELLGGLLKLYTEDEKKESLLNELVDKKILNTAPQGLIHDLLQSLKGYICSEYYENIPNGSHVDNGVFCVDLCNIPLQDATLDLIITEAVLEHVYDAKKAFAEISRVLKPEGKHVFSIPYSESLPKTRFRENLPPIYHVSFRGEADVLVYYEFGKDIIEFSKTDYTHTELISLLRFYDEEETSDFIRDYELYEKAIKPDGFFYLFKYNPATFVQKKDSNTGYKRYAGKYDLPLYEDNEDSRDYKLIKHIEKNSVILEFGCAEGNLTKYLKEKMNCDVYIIEYVPESYEIAMKYAKDGICGDIMNYEWLERFQEVKFDVILFSDVIEHLYDPYIVLSKTKTLLKDNGKILISVPNIGHNIILLNLFRDKFQYKELGLLDKDHIRFFTRESLINFSEEAGYSIVYEDATTANEFFTELYDINTIYNEELRKLLKFRKYGEVYQFILTLQKKEYVLKHKIEVESVIYSASISIGTIYFNLGNGFNEVDTSEFFVDKNHIPIKVSSFVKK